MQTSNPFGVPEAFYEIIKPYASSYSNSGDEKREVADTPSKLKVVWKAAIAARKAHPEDEELIAEWTMSAGASSPLVNDNDMFEDIHERFGRLEVPAEDSNQTAWEEIESLIDSLP